MSRPIAVDLFAGCGGVSEGLAQAGYEVTAAVELSDVAVRTYTANHPHVQVWHNDIREVQPEDILAAQNLRRGDVDLLAACAPCQGFSRLSTLNGTVSGADKRNDLVLAVLPFIRAMLPRAVMLENVPAAALSSQMGTVRRSLRGLGYRSVAAVVDAVDFAVPQRRRRYILLASRERKPEFTAGLLATRTVRDAISHLPAVGSAGDPLHDITVRTSQRIIQLIQQIPKDGGSRRSMGRDAQLPCHQRSDGFSDVYGRMAWDRPSPTITGGFVNPSKGRFLHPSEDRAITPREGALLQGFRDTYVFQMDRGKYAAAEMIGNAVPPALAAHHARLLLP